MWLLLKLQMSVGWPSCDQPSFDQSKNWYSGRGTSGNQYVAPDTWPFGLGSGVIWFALVLVPSVLYLLVFWLSRWLLLGNWAQMGRRLAGM